MTTEPATPPIERVIEARSRDVGGHTVRRLLPVAARRMIGPFTFFDHMGPVAIAPDAGADVLPHPHIGLATVTYLFSGELVHRDSIGSHQVIRPGDLNWMTAGRGIVHSERHVRQPTPSVLHGLQLWVALPIADEEVAPSFAHHPRATLPEIELAGGVRVRVLAGSGYGQIAPVQVHSPLGYVDAIVPADGVLPVGRDHVERAAYVVDGEVRCAGTSAGAGQMLVFAPDADVELRATRASRVVLIAGAPLEGARHVSWNFVSSSKQRLAEAALAWRERRFPTIPGDDVEFVPMPD